MPIFFAFFRSYTKKDSAKNPETNAIELQDIDHYLFERLVRVKLKSRSELLKFLELLYDTSDLVIGKLASSCEIKNYIEKLVIIISLAEVLGMIPPEEVTKVKGKIISIIGSEPFFDLCVMAIYKKLAITKCLAFLEGFFLKFQKNIFAEIIPVLITINEVVRNTSEISSNLNGDDFANLLMFLWECLQKNRKIMFTEQDSRKLETLLISLENFLPAEQNYTLTYLAMTLEIFIRENKQNQACIEQSHEGPHEHTKYALQLTLEYRANVILNKIEYVVNHIEEKATEMKASEEKTVLEILQGDLHYVWLLLQGLMKEIKLTEEGLVKHLEGAKYHISKAREAISKSCFLYKLLDYLINIFSISNTKIVTQSLLLAEKQLPANTLGL